MQALATGDFARRPAIGRATAVVVPPLPQGVHYLSHGLKKRGRPGLGAPLPLLHLEIPLPLLHLEIPLP